MVVAAGSVGLAAFAGALALLGESSSSSVERPVQAMRASPTATKAAQPAQQALRCPNGRPYFNYHEPLRAGALTLSSLFDGRGRVQPIGNAETLSFQLGPLNGRVDPISDNRTQMIPWRGYYYAVERLHYTGSSPGAGGAGHWNLFLFKSTDGKSLQLVPGRSPNRAMLSPATLGPAGQAYDAHVIVDYCSGPYDPARPDSGITFVMTFECTGLPGLPKGGGVCQSTSNDISDPNSWSRPRSVFTTSDNDHIVAGYPTMLWTGRADSTVIYAAATRELPSPQGAKETTRYLPRLVSYVSGRPTDIASAPHMMNSQPLATCATSSAQTASWDCNNRVVTDWKKEGDAYYVAFVGANYFDGVLPRATADLNADVRRTREEVASNVKYMPFAQYRGRAANKITQNRWAFSFARVVGSPFQDYTSARSRATFRVQAPISNRDFAGISSPVVNVVGGRMYVYYSLYEYDRAGNPVGKVKRSLIVARQ